MYKIHLAFNKKAGIINYSQSVFVIAFLLFILNTINFFLTNNPYRAYHSGRTAYSSSFSGSTYWISPAYIVLAVAILCLATALLSNRIILLDKLQFSFLSAFFFVCIINGSVFASPISFLFDFIMYFSVFELAAFSAKKQIRGNLWKEENHSNDFLNLFNNIVLFLLIFGIVLALLQRDRYGVINFDFSRVTRGEVTYWLFLGLHIIAVASSLATYSRNPKTIKLIPAFIVLLFQLAFVNRMGIIYVAVPLYLFFVLGTTNKRLIVFFSSLLLVLLLWNEIINMLGLNNLLNNNYDNFLNGRDELWSYCFDSLIENPVFGSGLNITSQISYAGGAFSEIGLLKIFAENGLIVGGIHLTILLIAIRHAFNIIRLNNYERISGMDLFCSFYLISCFVPMVFESHSRILNGADFLAWFSMYYMYRREIRLSNE